MGAVGNPESSEGFPSGLLESRSDFKGPVEDLSGQGRERDSDATSSLPQGRQPRQLPQDFDVGAKWEEGRENLGAATSQPNNPDQFS